VILGQHRGLDFRHNWGNGQRADEVLVAGGPHLLIRDAPRLDCYTAVLYEAFSNLQKRKGAITTVDLDQEILRLQPWGLRTSLYAVYPTAHRKSTIRNERRRIYLRGWAVGAQDAGSGKN